MARGDTVYLWRSQGKEKVVAGIVAKAHIEESPRKRPDAGPGRAFSIGQSASDQNRSHVLIRIDRKANAKEVLKREWFVEDPILKDLTILKMANMTNYILDGAHQRRVDDLWQNTGADWTRAESIAALRAYHRTYGGSLSQLPGSPIADTAILIGRAVKGVYNKVLNFRHIDPRDARKGFSGNGEVDREVWAEYYDAKTSELDEGRLEREFSRLWSVAITSRQESQHTATISTSEPSPGKSNGTYRPGPLPQAAEYTVSTTEHDDWFVYLLVLSNKKAVKVGFSHDPNTRLRTYNHAIMPELTGLSWSLGFMHKVTDANTAQRIEQHVLQVYSEHQLASNGEILRDVDATKVQLTIIRAAGFDA